MENVELNLQWQPLLSREIRSFKNAGVFDSDWDWEQVGRFSVFTQWTIGTPNGGLIDDNTLTIVLVQLNERSTLALEQRHARAISALRDTLLKDAPPGMNVDIAWAGLMNFPGKGLADLYSVIYRKRLIR